MAESSVPIESNIRWHQKFNIFVRPGSVNSWVHMTVFMLFSVGAMGAATLMHFKDFFCFVL